MTPDSVQRCIRHRIRRESVDVRRRTLPCHAVPDPHATPVNSRFIAHASHWVPTAISRTSLFSTLMTDLTGKL